MTKSGRDALQRRQPARSDEQTSPDHQSQI
jgi:hypothetical protein